MDHRDVHTLQAGLDEVRRSPRDHGRLELIVARPGEDRRLVLTEAVLDLDVGLVGDDWSRRPSSRTPDGSPHLDMQLNVINARFAALVAGTRERWALAGDQLYLDLDLSEASLAAGTRLAIGSAVIEITDQPHRGCAKFAARFGTGAARLVNSPEGRELRLRGLNARVAVAGTIRAGDEVRRLPDP